MYGASDLSLDSHGLFVHDKETTVCADSMEGFLFFLYIFFLNILYLLLSVTDWLHIVKDPLNVLQVFI